MLTLTHDITSPAAAVAVARFQRLADEGVPVTFRGLDVLGLGATVPVTLDVLAELERVRPRAEAHGLVLRAPSIRPPTAAVHLVADLAHDHGLGAAWRTVTYRAYWEDGVDLADPTILMGLAGAAGLDRDAVATLLGDRTAIAAVRRRTTTARTEGIGGVPVVVAHGTLVSADLDDDALRALAVG